MKNILGLLPGRGKIYDEKGQLHSFWTPGIDPTFRYFQPSGEKAKVHKTDLNQAIVDLNMIIKPTFNVLDGIVASYEHEPIRMDIVMASPDNLALDITALKITGTKVSDIKYYSYAVERNIGLYEPSEIRIKDLNVERLSNKWSEKTSRIPHI